MDAQATLRFANCAAHVPTYLNGEMAPVPVIPSVVVRVEDTIRQ